MEILKKRFSWLSERNLLVLLLLFCAAFGAYTANHLTQAFRSAVLFPWAMGMIYYALRRRELSRTAPLVWNCAGIAVVAVTAILRSELDTEWAHSIWLYAICAFFLLALPRKMTTRKQHTELLSIGAMFVTLFLPFALLCIVSIFTGCQFNLPAIEKPLGVITEGSVGSRIVVFAHPNTTSRFAVFNILFCIYALYRLRRRSVRTYFALNILVNTIILAHTQSRTCYIALAAGMAAIAFRGLFLMKKTGKWRFPAAVVAAAAAFALTLAALNGLYKLDVMIAQSMPYAKAAAASVQTRAEVEGQFDVFSNGRDDIWVSTIRYLLDNPKYLITGMGAGNLVSRIGESYPAILPHLNIHNTYLESLARYGAGYLLCMLGFLCSMLVPVVQILLTPTSKNNRGMYIFSVMIGVILVMSIPEEMLFTSTRWPNLLFYFLCGHVLHAAYLQKSEKTVPEETT